MWTCDSRFKVEEQWKDPHDGHSYTKNELLKLYGVKTGVLGYAKADQMMSKTKADHMLDFEAS